MPPATTPTARPKMNSAEIKRWREFIRKRTGLHFSDGRLYFLQQRLWERVVATKTTDYATYHDFLYSSNGQKEQQILIEHLLNNETRFFRHQSSYSALAEHVVPQLMIQKRDQSNQSVVAWSAGCSNGSEAYSMAMVLHHLLGALPCKIHVHGTDISQSSLRVARSGTYPIGQQSAIPSQYAKTYTRPVGGEQAKTFEVVKWLRGLVRFYTLNLCDESGGYPSDQDIIYCQNVLIYFDKARKVQVVGRMAEALKPGGFLFLGPAELLGLSVKQLRPIRLPDAMIYQKLG